MITFTPLEYLALMFMPAAGLLIVGGAALAIYKKTRSSLAEQIAWCCFTLCIAWFFSLAMFSLLDPGVLEGIGYA